MWRLRGVLPGKRWLRLRNRRGHRCHDDARLAAVILRPLQIGNCVNISVYGAIVAHAVDQKRIVCEQNVSPFNLISKSDEAGAAFFLGGIAVK